LPACLALVRLRLFSRGSGLPPSRASFSPRPGFKTECAAVGPLEVPSPWILAIVSHCVVAENRPGTSRPLESPAALSHALGRAFDWSAAADVRQEERAMQRRRRKFSQPEDPVNELITFNFLQASAFLKTAT